jgi:hypothetical protein
MTKTDASTSLSTAHQLKIKSKKQKIKNASGCSDHQLAFGLPPAPLLFP